MRSLLAATSLMLTATPVHSSPPVLGGEVCNRVAVSRGSDVWDLFLYGAIAAADVSLVAPDVLAAVADNPVSITLTCSVGVGREEITHLTADDGSASASGPAVAVLRPTFVPVHIPSGLYPTICTRVDVTFRDGSTYTGYWESARKEFTEDPSVHC